MSNNNSANRSRTPKCKGCGSEAGLVIAKAKHVKIPLYNYLYAVVISFNCKHCDCGTPVHFTYECCREGGVRLKEGYPDRYASAQKHSLQLPPLLSSQVNGIKNGTNWSAYNLFNSEVWANIFVEKLQNEKPEEVPRKIVKVDIIMQGTGRVLRRNVQMEYEVNKFLSNNNVTVEQVIVEAFEQSGLKKEGYKCCQVAQRKELADGSIGYVEADLKAPIVNAAVYKIMVKK